MSSPNCPICLATTSVRYNSLYDDRYGFPGTINLYLCFNCSHLFLDAHYDDATLQRLYTDYYPRSELSLESFRSASEVSGFKSWLNGEKRSAYCWVPENVRILDIGCGFGESLAYHKARGCEVYGVEADENIRRVADKYGFNVHVGLFDPDQYEPDFFDYVTLDQVIEHVTDPVTTLKGIARILKPGGTAILSTPNSNGWGARVFGRRWINWHAPYHLQHFSLESMRIAADKAGLCVERVNTRTSSDWLHFQWIHLVTYPEMGCPSSFWSTKTQQTRMQNYVVYLISKLHSYRINHIITRIFDWISLGDNFLFFLKKL